MLWAQCSIEESKIKGRGDSQTINETSQAIAAKSKNNFDKIKTCPKSSALIVVVIPSFFP